MDQPDRETEATQRLSKAIAAEQWFNQKTALEEAIAQKIFPVLAILRTAYGTTGMGFFQHGQWLVSNAQVIKHRSDLDSGVELKDVYCNTVPLEAEHAYHRPFDNTQIPNLVIIKANCRYNTIPRRLAIRLFRDDPAHPESLYFYVDFTLKIHYVTRMAGSDKNSLRFRSETGDFPQPGCSGTPLIAAKVLQTKRPVWEFEIIGALYAQRQQSSAENSRENSLYAAPVMQELHQILQVLNHLDIKTPHNWKNEVSGYRQNNELTYFPQQTTTQNARLAEAGIQRFEANHCELSTALPAGLEKLEGNITMNLEKSPLQREAIKYLFLAAQEEEQAAAQLKNTLDGLFKNNVAWGKAQVRNNDNPINRKRQLLSKTQLVIKCGARWNQIDKARVRVEQSVEESANKENSLTK